MYRFHTGGHGSPKIATAMTPKKTANRRDKPNKAQAKVEPRSTSSSRPGQPKPGHRASLVAKPTGTNLFSPALQRGATPSQKNAVPEGWDPDAKNDFT